jgi:tRNA A-37 threonylcarbamoyl transferase component Bud32
MRESTEPGEGTRFLSLTLSGTRILAREDVPDDWLRTVLERVETAPKHSSLALPDGTECHLKRYRRRPSHGILRRLRPGRAGREGRGYLAFRRAGISTVPLVAYGEKRRLGLLQRGFIVTERIPAPSVAEAWRASPRPELVVELARSLGRIHAAGLTHGDPRARNFLDADSGLLVFDLPSWGPCRPKARARDVAKLLSSVVVMTGESGSGRGLLAAYRESSPPLRLSDEDLVALSKRTGKHSPRA